MIRGSHSRHRLFDGCPRSAQAQWLEGMEPDHSENAPMQVGSIVHDLIEGELKTKAEQAAATHPLFRPEWGEDIDFLCGRAREVIEFLEPDAFDMLVEQSFAFDGDWRLIDYDDEGAWWRGRIDLSWVDADGTLRIVDWKTSRIIPHTLEGYDLQQILSYALWGKLTSPDVERIMVGAAYLRGGIKGLRWIEPTDEEMDAIRIMIETKQAAINKLDPEVTWPATPGHACNDCPRILECKEAKQQINGMPTPTTPDQMIEIYNQLQAYKALVNELDKLLKKGAETTGPVELPDGKVLDHHYSETWVCTNKQGLLQHMATQGLGLDDLYKSLKLGSTALNAMAKSLPFKRGEKGPFLDAAKRDFGVFSAKTTFQAKKI